MRTALRSVLAVTRRELLGLTKTPTALLFLLVFSGLANLVVLGQERLFDRGQADLAPLFQVFPWLCLLLLPALSMGLFSEERRAGSIELLLTLPLEIGEVVLGKFLGALLFAGLALLGTTPLWIAIATFGAPDHGAILTAYFGAFLLAGALLSIGTFVSALTRNPASAFVAGVTLGFLFLFSDVPAIGRALPASLADGLARLSFAARYEALSRGVVGLDDLLFFVGTAGAFLLATVLLLKSQRRARPAIGPALGLVGSYLLLALLVAPRLAGLRLDNTEGELHSLSPATRALAAELESELTFTLYLSEEAAATSPRFLGFTRFVESRLADLARASRGKLRYELADAAPYSSADDEARAAGLSHVALGVAGGGRELVFGLVAKNEAGDTRSIAFLSPEDEAGLEHQLARLMLELSRPEKRVIGVLTSFVDGVPPGDPLTGGLAGRGWQVVESQRAAFDFRLLRAPLSAVPADLDVLWVLHPKKLDRMTLTSLDRYARGGGSLLIQIDPLAEVDRTGMDVADTTTGYVAERESDLGELLEAWGIEMIPRRVLGDRRLGSELPAGSVGNTETVTFPHWFSLGPDEFEEDPHLAPMFQGLQRLNFASAGALVLTETAPEDLERRPLLRTSGDSMRLDVSLVQVILEADSLMRDFVPTGKPEWFGIELTGLAPAAFPGEVVAEPAPMRAVVIADVDCAGDALWVRPNLDPAGEPTGGFRAVADNGAFFARLFSELAGGAPLALAGARREGARYTRPLERFEALEKAAEERLARELSAARTLEAELSTALLTASEEYARTGGTGTPSPEVAALELRLAAARARLKELLRDRDAEVDALKRRATLTSWFAWPAICLAGWLLSLRRPR